jgi:UMF1 family MFS transporter
VAVWYALFSIPIFLWLKEPSTAPSPPMGQLLKAARSELVETFREIRKFRDAFRLLVARLIYNDGLITIFALSAIYASEQFGIDPFVLGITLNVAAGLGAFAMGYLDDYIGGKITILISIVGLAVSVFIAVLTYNIVWFWGALFLGAILAGPNQAASRSLFGRFVPDKRENEFYGFYAFSGKFTSFMGPLLVSQFALIFDSQRIGFSTLIVLFVVGGIILLGVNEKNGMRAAGHLENEII